jgi:hypothetical protein
MKNCGGVSKRNRWQSAFGVLMKESFGKVEAGCDLEPPKDRVEEAD